MIVTCVTVSVKPEYAIAFIQATVENHRNSVREKGNLRFDFLQCSSDPTRFFLYEAYETEEDAAAHKNTPHYLRWKEAVAPWMAGPRDGVSHTVIVPADISDWK